MKRFKLTGKAKDRYITYGMMLILFAVIQIFVASGQASRSFTGLLVPTCVYVLAALARSLGVGGSGGLSLGQAGFMCIGAYTGSIFSVAVSGILENSAIRFPIALLLGGVTAAFFGFLIGIPVLRLRGDYLAIVTLAFGEIIKSVFDNLYISTDKNGLFISLGVEGVSAHTFDAATRKDYLKGAMGISGTPKDSTFLICFITVMIALVVMLNFMDSKQGRAVMAARENRIAAEAMGVNVTRAKMTAFVMSAFFAGVAGVLYSHNLNVLAASKFDYNLSILILVFVVLGGMRKMRNVVISTVVLYVLPEALRGLNKYRMLIYAIVLITMMLLNNSAAVRNFLEKIRMRAARTGQRRKAGGEG